MSDIGELLQIEIKDSEKNALSTHTQSLEQLILSKNAVKHHAKAGVNPLVDCAAHLFSVMGKLALLKEAPEPTKLRNDLIEEINSFLLTAKQHGYSSEYIVASRYALCVSFDDIISHTSWGAAASWEENSLLSSFKQDSINHERFYVVLERLIREPDLYIDIMEFMYICLSLGFKGNFRGSDLNHVQLEHITTTLYNRIRAVRGDIFKTLSPFQIKLHTSQQPLKNNMLPGWLILLLTVSICFLVYSGLRYMLNLASKNVYYDLSRIGTSQSHETTDENSALQKRN